MITLISLKELKVMNLHYENEVFLNIKVILKI